ncbi:MAG: hypothetical protein JWM16_5030 [Verrucomicrobiales bacterium]|nr:hypothetical protein [Verrucomicrobiales bacterium]
MQNPILEILARAWNPGGFSHGQALGQYESLVPEVARRLLGRASRDELARYLHEKDVVAGEADRFHSLRWQIAEKVAASLLELASDPGNKDPNTV